LGLLGLAACGDLPQPFRGQPGEVAARLARPPAYRIAIPPPAGALQTRAQAEAYAEALAEQLMAQDVPAVAGPPWPLDWVVEVSATRQPAGVLPHYRLRDGDGTLLGEASGRMVSTRDWLAGDDAALRRAAADGAQSLATLVARADALRRTGDDRTAGAGPLVVRLLPVRGAPGDGNRSLTARMSEQLAALGFRVQDQSDGAQFAVQGVVEMASGTRGQQRIEIVWTVQRRDGFDLGRVLQLNEVPAGSLNGLWGDVAFVVANEAAGGIRDVIANAQAAPPPAEGAQPAPAAAVAPPPPAPVPAPVLAPGAARANRASRATPASLRR
jgi:hypothetical protein